MNVTRTFARWRNFWNIFQASIYLEEQFFPCTRFIFVHGKIGKQVCQPYWCPNNFPRFFHWLGWLHLSFTLASIGKKKQRNHWDLPHNTCRWSNSASEFQLRDLWDSWIRGWVCLNRKKTQTQWFINKSLLKLWFWDKPKSYIVGCLRLYHIPMISPHSIIIYPTSTTHFSSYFQDETDTCIPSILIGSPPRKKICGWISDESLSSHNSFE